MRKSRNDRSKKGATTLKRNLITKPVFFYTLTRTLRP